MSDDLKVPPHVWYRRFFWRPRLCNFCWRPIWMTFAFRRATKYLYKQTCCRRCAEAKGMQ